MTGEQKPGGLSEAWRVLRKTFSDRFEDGNDHEIERMEAAVAAAEPAEARIKFLEHLLEAARFVRAEHNRQFEAEREARFAAEAKLARAVEAGRRQADNMAFVLNHAEVGTWYEKFTAELAEDRAALQQEGE